MKLMLSALVLLSCLAFAALCSAAPPILTTPTTENVGAGMATLVLKSSSIARGYFTLLAGSNAACGTGTQVKAGQDSSGAPAPYHGSLLLLSNTSKRYTVRNLTQSTAYTICYTAQSTDGLNPTPAKSSLTTTAAKVITNPRWGEVGSAMFSAGQADWTSLAFARDGTPYVAYKDGGNGNKATVMQYSGGAWVAVGSAGFSTDAVAYTSLAFSPTGFPYVAYQDAANGNKATVMQYSGGVWSVVGGAGFSVGQADYISLAFAPDGTPYVAYQDWGNSKMAIVMQYDGSAWIPVGSGVISNGQADYTSLAFAPDGTPYVAYRDQGYSGMVSVMKYSDNAWAPVLGGYNAYGGGTSLAIAPNGTPYVAFDDSYNSGSVTVRGYSGGAWYTVGLPTHTNGRPSLAIAPDGNPYVEHEDSNTHMATVLHVVMGEWVPVGNATFSAGAAAYTSLVFAPDGTPYVAYRDRSYKATVMALKNGTTTTVGSNINPSTDGQPVTFTATVTPAAAAGTVTFKDGGATLASIALSGGAATYNTTYINMAGNHSITAIYSGDNNYAGSTSAPLTQTVLISVSVSTIPSGLSITVDGATTTAPQAFSWVPGSSHTIATISPQDGSAGTRYVFGSWSDAGALSHTVSPFASTNYGASFSTQYMLATTITGNGTVTSGDGIDCSGTPQTGTCSAWGLAGANVILTAVVNNSVFSGWGGDCAACGSNLLCLVTVDGVKTCNAAFDTPSLVTVTGTAQIFAMLQPAYDAAGNGAIMKAQAVTFTENLLLNIAGRTVTIKGGYEPTFTTQNGVTTIDGSLTIRNGSLKTNRLKLR